MAFETCLLKWNKHEWRYTLCIDILARSLYSSLALRIFKKDLTLAMAPWPKLFGTSTKAYQALRLNLCTPHHPWPRRRRYNYQCRENQPVSRTGSCKKFQLRSYERSNNSTRFQWHCKFSQKFDLASCHMKRQARPHNAKGYYQIMT
jgi:hypothetical protein